MLCRKTFPYTAAWHVFKTPFPIMAERRFLLSVDEIRDVRVIETAHTGSYNNWFHEPTHANATIAKMASIHSSGGKFAIVKPELYAKHIYELLTHHLRQWEEATRGFIRRELDDELRANFVAMDMLADDILEVAKWYGATRSEFSDDKFLAALRRSTDLIGKISGKVLTTEKLVKEFNHNSFAETFQARGLLNGH